jgi:hypothetical protein
MNAEELRNRPENDLLELFGKLETATIDELDGEYIGAIPLPGALEFHKLMTARGKGEWGGKSYQPTPYQDFPGQGYNTYMTPDGVVRCDRFSTEVGPSPYDGRPSLIMRYATFAGFYSRFGVVDEVRRYAPTLYLCIGHTGGERPQPFIIRGPFGPALGPDDAEAEVLASRREDVATG